MKVVIRNKVSRFVLLLMVIGAANVSLGGHLARGFGQQALIDWDKVKSAFRDYLRNPIPEKAKVFLDTLPREKTRDQTDNESAAVDHIYDNYLSFEAGVLAGDRYLTEAAFRLLNFLDGAFARQLSKTLGDLATRNPWLFLDYLYRYRNSQYVKKAGPPVFGTSHKDRAEDVLEWKKRIEALKAVEETRYRQIRDECIRLLEEAIEKYQKSSPVRPKAGPLHLFFDL